MRREWGGSGVGVGQVGAGAIRLRMTMMRLARWELHLMLVEAGVCGALRVAGRHFRLRCGCTTHARTRARTHTHTMRPAVLRLELIFKY